VADLGTTGAIKSTSYTANAWNIDIGLNWKASDEWSFGVVAKNLFRLTESELPEGVLEYGLQCENAAGGSSVSRKSDHNGCIGF